VRVAVENRAIVDIGLSLGAAGELRGHERLR
jgi:hypothetical protein